MKKRFHKLNLIFSLLLGAIFILAVVLQNPKRNCVQGDCKNGRGILEFTKGLRYTGEFKDGLQHGFGTFADAKGNRYEGSWHKGKKQGFGTYSYPGGETYSGFFHKDKKDNLSRKMEKRTIFKGQWVSH
ncbi:MAG: hypothetical protein H7A25_25925 [Leptospiraceae bacterium]|nr:hypothetical protein [Leptospiraceae bacterium]